MASEHLEEYQAKLALVRHNDMQSLIVRWELGKLFARYGEPIRDLAKALELSFSTIQRHLLIAKLIPSREKLNALLTSRPDIQTWQDLLVWAEARPAGDGQGSRQKSIQLTVPTPIVKALADQGCNAREVMMLFWQNVSPMLLITVAYPDRPARSA